MLRSRRREPTFFITTGQVLRVEQASLCMPYSVRVLDDVKTHTECSTLDVGESEAGSSC